VSLKTRLAKLEQPAPAYFEVWRLDERVPICTTMRAKR
jgi:hypothetical protein